jgi:hypothetical protein
MGLPKALGPYGVSFVEFELRRTAARGGEKEGHGGLPSAEGAPLMRIFYPTASKKTFSVLNVKNRSWLPNVDYLVGFLSRAISPSTSVSKAFVWTLSCTLLACPIRLACSCSVPGDHPSRLTLCVMYSLFGRSHISLFLSVRANASISEAAFTGS